MLGKVIMIVLSHILLLITFHFSAEISFTFGTFRRLSTKQPDMKMK